MSYKKPGSIFPLPKNRLVSLGDTLKFRGYPPQIVKKIDMDKLQIYTVDV